ncbi:MAG TPA: oxidoreductase C-terminal domain-containing protein [Gemmataceae bacterium]|nr:oxidoreductase C-terminal domain-containing protein [Gemmataceae bacterium]
MVVGAGLAGARAAVALRGARFEGRWRCSARNRKFVVFWLKDGLLVAGLNVNTWNVADTIAALVAARRPIDTAALADPAADLSGLVPAANLTAEADPLSASHAAAVDGVLEQAPVPGGVSEDEGSAASATAGYSGLDSSLREIPGLPGRWAERGRGGFAALRRHLRAAWL